MNITVIVGVIGAVCAVFSAWLGYRNGVKKDGSAEGSLRSDIGYIKANLDDIKTEQRRFNILHYELSERVGRVEESAKSAHHRIDTLEAQMK